MDLNPAITAILGVVLPIIVQLIRTHILPWGGKAATWLTFVIAVIVVALAYLTVDKTPSWHEAFKQIGMVFTVATLIYRSLKDSLKLG